MGSPNIHSFSCVLNTPLRNHNSVGECIEFLYTVACSNLLSEQEDLDLWKLVKNFQIYCDSKT